MVDQEDLKTHAWLFVRVACVFTCLSTAMCAQTPWDPPQAASRARADGVLRTCARIRAAASASQREQVQVAFLCVFHAQRMAAQGQGAAQNTNTAAVRIQTDRANVRASRSHARAQPAPTQQRTAL